MQLTTHHTGHIVGQDLLAEDVPELPRRAVRDVVLRAVTPASHVPPNRHISRQRDKETKKQRDKETKKQRDIDKKGHRQEKKN